jgi:ParB family chromosome partitioning protein
VEIYDLSLKLTNLPEPGASITWAREIKNLNRKLLTPTVLDTVIQRINNNEITNSKEVRKLRQVLKDPVARDKFLCEGGTIESALRDVAPVRKKGHGLVGDIEELTDTLKRYSWTTLAEMKRNPLVLRKLEEAERLLKELKKAISR